MVRFFFRDHYQIKFYQFKIYFRYHSTQEFLSLSFFFCRFLDNPFRRPAGYLEIAKHILSEGLMHVKYQYLAKQARQSWPAQRES